MSEREREIIIQPIILLTMLDQQLHRQKADISIHDIKKVQVNKKLVFFNRHWFLSLDIWLPSLEHGVFFFFSYNYKLGEETRSTPL